MAGLVQGSQNVLQFKHSFYCWWSLIADVSVAGWTLRCHCHYYAAAAVFLVPQLTERAPPGHFPAETACKYWAAVSPLVAYSVVAAAKGSAVSTHVARCCHQAPFRATIPDVRRKV